MNLVEIKKEILKQKDPVKTEILKRFFKTGKGEYGEGDKFYGIKVPIQRRIAKQFEDLSLDEIQILLGSPIHEERLIALLILVEQFSKCEESERDKIFNFYIQNRKGINNWDLVDLTAPKIVGEYLIDKEKDLLYKFAHSKILWEKRITIISTFTFIKSSKFSDTFKLSVILLNDQHDLIHKAVGWMLREIGKRNLKAEEEFLAKHYNAMPRTMLRYAIEKFPEKKRRKYLEGKI